MLLFTLGVLTIVAALYIPGFLFFRGLRFTRLHAVIAAPIYSAAAYGVLPIGYYEIGIPCNAFTVIGPALAVALLVYIVSARRGDTNRYSYGLPQRPGVWMKRGSASELASDWAMLALYIACGMIICGIVFAANLPSPDVAYIRYDNQTHLNVSKAFLESGMWSSLHPNRYLDVALASRPTGESAATFYPALLYVLSALTASIAGIKITAAFNAVLYALCAIVFPMGMFGIIRIAFKDDKLVIVLGAIAAAAFAGFPWGVFVRGLFPNAAAYCLMAPAIASTMALVAHPSRKGAVCRGVVFWIFAFPALGLAQPNAVFGAFLFLVAFEAHAVGDRLAHRAELGSEELKARLKGIAIIAAIALIIWIICMNLGPLQSVVHYFGNSIQRPWRVFRRLITLRFDPFYGQYLLAVISVLGAVLCLRKRAFWVLFPAFWMFVAYFVIRTQNNALTHFLAGFWYSDHVRIAGIYCIYLMPIIAMGLAGIVRGVLAISRRIPILASPVRGAVCSALAIVLVMGIVYCPNISLHGSNGPEHKTGYGSVYTELHNMYRINDNRVYGSDEQAFVDRAREITGDAIVLNYPMDGSTFAYAANDMNVYFRSMKSKGFTDVATTIRKGLKDYASNPKVRAAVESTGAQYFMKLDHGVSYEDGKWFRQFTKPERWKAVEGVGDDTPGFTVVLAEGDMRLYRIEAVQ